MATRTASRTAGSERAAKKSRAKADPYFAKIVGKALAALDTIRRSPDALTLHQVTAMLGGAKSSVFRILHTLEVLGYVERDSTGRYRLPSDVRSAERAPFLAKLIRYGTPLLKQMNRELQETVSLAALFDNHIEVVAVIESPQIIRMGNMVGRILPPHASSLGKSIAAFQSEARQEKLLRSYGIYGYTPHTITDEAELEREFERTRERGYSVDQEENTEGGICFGAPIFAGGPHAVAAISVSAPKMRLRESREAVILDRLRRAAGELSRKLTGV